MSTFTSNNSDSRIFSYQNDGLIDLFIGFAIFFAGLFLWTEMVWMAAIFIPVFLPTFQSARKRFLEPRIGKLQQSSQQQIQNQKVLFSITLLLGVLFLAGIAMFLAFDLLSGPVNMWLKSYFLLVIGIVFSSVWIFAAVMLKISRFYLYAAFTFAALAVAQFSAIPFWIALVILGSLIILVGTVILLRFMQQHPIEK
jgi:hypothetical protein